MERILYSPLGVVVRLGAGMQLALAAPPLLSVHFRCSTMAPRPSAAAGDDDSFSFSPPFYALLNESRWERQARDMILRVTSNVVHPRDFRFLVHAFCDFSRHAVQRFLMQDCGGRLSLSMSLRIPDATAAVGPHHPPRRPHIPDAAASVGPHHPPRRPHIPDATAAVGPHHPPRRPHLLPDIVVGPYDHLMRAYLPENSAIHLDDAVLVVLAEEEGTEVAGGRDAAVDAGNKPASASAVHRLKRVLFGEGNGAGCRETSCAVCINDFEATSVLLVMPCGHGFHSACLEEWFKRSNLCPLCRFSLPAAN